MIGAPQILVPTTVVTVQLTVTPLLAARDLSAFSALVFYFLNDDGTNTFDVTIESGESPNAFDDEFRPILTVPVTVSGITGQRSLVLPENLRSIYRVSAIASGAPVSARWGLRGIRRPVLAPLGIR